MNYVVFVNNSIMTLLKLLLPKIVMVSVLPNLTRNITDLKLIRNPFITLENFLTRNLRGLIRNPNSLKGKNLEPNQRLISITKKLYVTSVV